MALLDFDRWDFLGTRVVLALTAVLTPVVTVGLPLVDWARGEPLTWQGDVASAQTLSASRVTPTAGTELIWEGGAQVRLDDPGTGVWLVSLLPGLLLSLVVVVVTVLLWRLLSGIQSGRPFVASSVGALRLIAAAIITGSIVVPIAAEVVRSVVVERAVEEPPTGFVLLTATVGYLAIGLLVAALAEAFAVGVRLADDTEGLV